MKPSLVVIAAYPRIAPFAGIPAGRQPANVLTDRKVSVMPGNYTITDRWTDGTTKWFTAVWEKTIMSLLDAFNEPCTRSDTSDYSTDMPIMDGPYGDAADHDAPVAADGSKTTNSLPA